MRTSSNTNKLNSDKTISNLDNSSDTYIVWLVTTLDPEKSAESALLLADKMNVSISKMMHLLSRKPGPLSKAISKEQALKLAKVLESVGVKTEVISKNKLLQDKNKQIPKENAPVQLKNQVKTKKAPGQRAPKSKAPLEEEGAIKVDLDNILDRINAKTEETKQKTVKTAKLKRRSRSLLALGLLSVALVVTYLASSFSGQISEFVKGVIAPVKAESTQNSNTTVEDNLDPEYLRELSTADLMSLATANSPRAQYELAYRYGSQNNYESAIQWLVPAAEGGHPEAQYLLGLYYQYGHGLEQDSAKSKAWYSKASEQGLAEAQYRLGLIYLEDSDQEQAINLLTSASQQGNIDASLKLNGLVSDGQSSDIFAIAKTASPAQLLLRLEPNQNLNIKDSYDQTPLMYAASQNNAEAVQILINSGADPNLQSDDAWTALMYAARDNPEVIKTLLTNGANPDIVNNDGQTALDIAKENFDNAEDYFVLDEF